MHPVAFLFPGQGAQSVGMGAGLAENYPAARQLFAQADEILGFSLSSLAWQGPEADLNDTINTQPALFVHSVAAWKVLKQDFPALQPVFVAGHSMGQLSALVASGALPFADGLRLARRRGELMKQAGETNPGGMAAVLGAEISLLEQICAQASTAEEIVQVANDNCPGQVVISGAKPALERAMALAAQAGIRRIRPLAVSIAAHSPLMAPAQADFNQAIASIPLVDPLIPLVGNVSARPLTTVTGLAEDLNAQLTSRVRWTETIRFITAQGVQNFIELGNGNVLAGLIKRIDDQANVISLGAPADFEKFASLQL